MLIDAQIENVGALPLHKPEGKIVRLTTDGDIYISDGTNWKKCIVVPAAGDADKIIKVKTDESGYELINKSEVIQDYTAVGTVGSANQQFAGRDYTLAELQAYFGAKLVSFYKFSAGALGTDELGAYDYTLGAAAKEPSSGVGIMGVADTAISFDGGDYATNATKFDDMTTRFSGASKGLIHSFWLVAQDGQPASAYNYYYKANSAANDSYNVSLATTGQISWGTRGNSATQKVLQCSTILTDGGPSYFQHIVLAWDITNGKRMWLNGKLEAQDITATTLMVDDVGAGIDFFIGGSDATPTDPFTGRIANEIIVNDVCTQAMVDFLYATTIPLPTALQGKDFAVRGRYKNLGVATDIRTFEPEITQIRTTDILLKPSIAWQATDSRRLVGEV